MLEDHPVDLDRSFAPSLGFMTRGDDKHPVFAVVTSVRPLGEPENASVEHLPADHELELLSAVWGAAPKGASLVRGPVRVVTGAPRRIFGWGTLGTFFQAKP